MLDQKLVEIFEKLEELVKQFQPEALDKAVNILQINAVNNIVISLLIISLTALLLIVLWKKQGEITEHLDIEKCNTMVAGLCTAAIVLGIMFSIILSIVSLCSLLDIWNWIGIFNPKLALAKKILGM